MSKQTRSSGAYIPGVCNINAAEIAYRRNWAFGAFSFAGILLIILILISAGRWYRWLIFIPLLIGVTNALQVRNKFCVTYGAAGLQNARQGSLKPSKVTRASDLALDKRKTNRINRQAFNIALFIMLLSLLIPT